jgi:hypothetical protein
MASDSPCDVQDKIIKPGRLFRSAVEKALHDRGSPATIGATLQPKGGLSAPGCNW